jgi:hypothetical protein
MLAIGRLTVYENTIELGRLSFSLAIVHWVVLPPGLSSDYLHLFLLFFDLPSTVTPKKDG